MPPPQQERKRQHHVWAHYLSGWEKNGSVYFTEKTDIDPKTNSPKNLAVSNYFYRIDSLTMADIELLRNFIGDLPQASQPHVREQLLKIISPILSSNLSKISHDIYKTNALEIYHTNIENSFIPLLSRARESVEDFKVEDAEHITLFNYIAHQFLRTRKIKRATSPDNHGDIWGLISLATAMNFGCNLYLIRNTLTIRVVDTTENKNLITGDQPVINILNEICKNPADENSICLYYPISPSRGMMIFNSYIERYVPLILNDERSSFLNNLIRESSELHLFAISPDDFNF